MRKLFGKAAALLLATLLLLSCSPAARAADSGNINFGVTVAESTLADDMDIIIVEVAEGNDEAFAALAEQGKTFSFRTDCGFENAYVVFDAELNEAKTNVTSGGTLVESNLKNQEIQFSVKKSGIYLIVDGTAPVVTNSEGQIKVTVSAQNAMLLDSFTVVCTLKNPTVKLDGKNIAADFTSGKLTFDLDKAGEYAITGEAVSEPETEVTGVTVTAGANSVEPGKKLTFAAAVSGTNTADMPVTWKVTGNTDKKTKISQDGVLTVGGDETGSSLTVTATAGGKSGSKTVTVTRKQEETEPPEYKITKGNRARWNQGSTSGLDFTTDADADLTQVKVDGKVLSKAHYDVCSGKVILKSGYLEKLSKGRHTIVLCYEDGGQAEGYFTIRGATTNVFTGDRFPLFALSGVMVVSLIALMILLIWKKKR